MEIFRRKYVLTTEGYSIMGKRFFVEVLMNPEEREEGEA